MSSVIKPRDEHGSITFDRPLDTITHRPVYNVKSYGAIGDNVNDDTIPIQDALNDAAAVMGEVFFPATSTPETTGYRVTGTLTIPEGVSIVGEGVACRWPQESAVTIYHDPQVPDTDLFLLTWDSGTSWDYYANVGRIHNLRCIGTANSRYCFNADHIRNCDFRHLYIQFFEVGIWTRISIHSTFRQMLIENCRDACVVLAYDPATSSTSSYWEHGYFRTSPIGVRIEKINNGHVFDSCLVESHTKCGFKLGCHSRVTLNGCYSENVPDSIVEATSLVCSDGSLVVTDASAPFANVSAGDFLSIANHSSKGLAGTRNPDQNSLNATYGYYKIASVDSDSQITLDAETGSPATGDMGTGGDPPALGWIIPGDGCIIDVGDTIDPNLSDSSGAQLSIHGGFWMGFGKHEATGIPLIKCDRVANLSIHGGYWRNASGMVSTTAETGTVVLTGVDLVEVESIGLDVDPASRIDVFSQTPHGPNWWFVEPETPLNLNDQFIVDSNGNTTMAGQIAVGGGSTEQISGGSINYTSAYVLIQPEGDTTGDDELTDIAGGTKVGQIIYIRCWTTLVGATTGITVKSTGNLRLFSDAVLYNSWDSITLMYSGAVWFEVARNVADYNTSNDIVARDAQFVGKFATGNGATEQISNGAIDFTSSYLLIQPEGDIFGDDELININGGANAGEILVLRCWTTLTGATTGITIRHNAPGNLRLNGDAILKNSWDTLTFYYSGAVWCELSRNVINQQSAIADLTEVSSLGDTKDTVNSILALLRNTGILAP